MNTTHSPAVSIIIPAYKQAAYISACLDSIIAQDYPGKLDIIVVDDGSDDDGADIAQAHHAAPRVIRQANTGVSGARNTGFAHATADWIAYLDADDKWLPGKLARQMSALAAGGKPALSFTRYRRVDPAGVPVPRAAEHPSQALRPSTAQLIRQNFIGTSTVITHRACVERAGGFPATHGLLRAGQDYALWLRIAAYFPLVYIPHVLTDYTVHPTNRVGIDPLKHHQGGISALRALAEWAPERFTSMSGGLPLPAVIARRHAKLLKDLITRRRDYPPDTLARFARSLRDGSL